jgi:hypothetical protein
MSPIGSNLTEGATHMTFKITKHAEKRMNQRGIHKDFLSLLLAAADIEVPVGGHSMLYRLSRTSARDLGVDDRLNRYGAIVSQDGVVVTVLAIHQTAVARQYKPSHAA